MTTLMCLLLTATTWHDMAGRGERTAMLLQCAVKLAVLIYVLRKPSSFWEHRAWASPCIRILFHLSPVMRRTGVGVYLLLERHAPKPGWYGAWADAACILAGTRQLGAAVGGLTLMMPPAQMLLTQTLLLLLTRNEPAYCTAPLLTHPLVHQRSALVATVLEYATLPILLLPFKPVGADIAALVAASQSGTQLCGALLTFFQVALIIIGPTLAAIHCPPRAPQQRAMQRLSQAASKVARRAFHTSRTTRSADYEHREHMYELWNMKGRKMKMGLAVGATVGLGIAVPAIAAELQFWKARGGN
ncbi:hypothetical protein C2E21_1834 [Chlorella sorokiniana]|uniref:Uncharacterized protein n=1 Tax=Chlorella sorokiniana TaxID=3076 RepID=A0A2P6U001_CHLSO|nr:hypothetical protein C2E21_1834 [Chlorella sorokiniana]|eukprot:PRW59647.1 hypothetical protein C2E21_1834 [Chlorella sorokiniana]